MKMTARTLVLLAVAVLAIQGCASTATTTFTSEALPADRYVAKVDQWVIVADDSTSMGDRVNRERKLAIEENFLKALNTALPEVGYQGSLVIFGRGPGLPEGKVNTLWGPATYTTDAFAKALEPVKYGGGNSPLDLGLAAAGDALTDGKTAAIVIVSDGLNMGAPDVAAAAALKGKFGDKLNIYAVQVGNDAGGRALLERVVKAGGNGYVTDASALTDWTALSRFVVDVFLWPDDDGDGVPDHLDTCPGTPKGVAVDATGCPPDSDGDGVPDFKDTCPNTPAGVKVDASGCCLDDDGDGVPNFKDTCPNTPAGVKVDASGCCLDSDGDGVPDFKDTCPGTPGGVPVDENGCPPPNIVVHDDGTWEVKVKVFFDVNKATIRDEAKPLLDEIARSFNSPRYLDWKAEVQGHCDRSGPKAFNDRLSQKRAEAVRDYLVSKGVAAERLIAKGYGWNVPRYPNDTAENRARNRRVEFKPFK